MNKDDFFREFTIRISSSLSIKTALPRAFDLLKEVMPLEMASLMKRDESLQALRCIARVTADCLDDREYGEITPLPEHLWAKKNTSLWAFSKAYILDDSDGLAHQLAVVSKLAGFSIMVVPLWMDQSFLGCLSLMARGNRLYSQSHLDLANSVARPTAIAFANALAHEDLIRYRDILIDDNRFLSRELLQVPTGGIIGAKGGLRDVVELVKQVAPLNNTVLLLGETGSGKEVIANAIHAASQRKEGPFIKVNCGAIPEGLIDSELFGHEKGAFTGAAGEKRGRFERAHGGTIFLDEIGELPLNAQVRLLRVLQNREIERVGGTTAIPVDIRVIAATHRNLELMISTQTFREDLWYRLNVFPLTIPPLRQRKEDIPVLTKYFLERKSLEFGLRPPPTVASGVLARLAEYPWPGNVRELENIVERELIRYRGGELTFETLSPLGRSEFPAPEAKVDCLQQSTNLEETVRELIKRVMASTGGKIHGPGGAAELMGIKGNALRSKMDKLGIPFRRR